MPARPPYVASAFIVFFLLLLLAVLPLILGAFPQTAAAVPTSLWVTDRIWQASAVVGLVSTVLAICAFLHRCFSSQSQRTPTPAALEEGAASDATPSSESRLSKTTYIFNAMGSALLPFNYFLSHGTLSLDKPLLVNVAEFAMFLIDGLESIAVIVVLVCVGAKVYQVSRRSTTETEGKEEEAVPEAVGEKHAYSLEKA
ncbi:hypothetical protein FB45DRAFT_941241 [Roridomyces roridus]|uniref:Transmembrane protein n=1 Tax=Roridomyces roridus TaxID=1738132 RepID=A0AAD7B633_9AGAR|nr:hypothetical protein FB45DRAFT_941241 [Roridomyces roridus]